VIGGTPDQSWPTSAKQVQFAYSPTQNRWRSLTATVPDRVALASVWTGREVLVWAGGAIATNDRVVPAGGVSYTPATGVWAPIPRAPLTGRLGSVVAWTGHELLAWGGTGARDGARYRPRP
jgi:hypothetical protein